MTMEIPSELCLACGSGRIVAVARPGRLVPYRGELVEVPADFGIPTCDHCGVQVMAEETAREFSLILKIAYSLQHPKRPARDATPTRPIRLPHC